MRCLSLCSGIGGLELGLHSAIPGFSTVAFVEKYRLLPMRDAIEMQIRDFRAFSAYFHGGVSRTPATFVKFQRERARALGYTEFRVLIYNPESSVVIWAADYESALRLVFTYGRI